MTTMLRTVVLAIALFSGACIMLPAAEYPQAAAVPVVIHMDSSVSASVQQQPQPQPQPQQTTAEDRVQAIMGDIVVLVAQEILGRL